MKERLNATIKQLLKFILSIVFIVLLFKVIIAIATVYVPYFGQVKESKVRFEILKKAAKEGNLQAQLALDNMWHDYEPAKAALIKQIKKSADAGDPKSQFKLAGIYYNGKGTKQDYDKSVRWYQKAADQGLAEAQHELGNMYLNGHGVEKNVDKALYWYERAAEQGFEYSYNLLINIYYNGDGAEKNIEKALYWHQKAIENGFDWLKSFYRELDKTYRNGYGVKENREESANRYTKSAEQEYDKVQFAIAFKQIKKSAEAGNAESQFKLAEIYYSGQQIVQKNREEAFIWYQKAAEQGHSDAQYKLGEMYYYGEGVKQDRDESVKWIKKAAEQKKPNSYK